MNHADAPNPKADPNYKSTLQAALLGARLTFHMPHDVFSNTGIDEGTLLLLDHLPAGKPRQVLDLGCGYGALGLPIAARFPDSTVELVDRDLLPASWAATNARVNKLVNVDVQGSLGYRDLKHGSYDWILCNVPARIGKPFIEHMLEAGRALLTPGGEARIVVIRDLAPLIEELAKQRGWPVVEAARGPRHAIYALAADPKGANKPTAEPANLYARDTVEVGGLKLERPFDLRGDDPRLIASGLPLLLDALPRKAPAAVLCFRAGYGPLPLVARTRWPEAAVTAIDRDLLTSAFTRRNAESLGLAGSRLSVREAPTFADALQGDERFDLAIGELSPAAGERAAGAELDALAAALAHDGQALLLSLDKLERDWLRPFSAARARLSVTRLISRDGYAISRLANR